MSKKSDVERPEGLDNKIRTALDEAYTSAEDYFHKNNNGIGFMALLSPEMITALDGMAALCEKASAGYLNVITSLAIKSVLKEKVDVRYHQVQIQKNTDRPAGFNFRGLSEKVIYNWMESHEFHGAKSGWQTRTFERPKPYMLDYDENIGVCKTHFLSVYDQLEEHAQDPLLSLTYILWRRIQLRESSKIELAKPKISDVQLITKLFENHFFYSYKDAKGGSRLPVLALFAIYSVLINELSRYKGKILKPLEAHSAADSQTGAIGDIEIVNQDGTAFEAVEVKHDIQISSAIVNSAKQKIRGKEVDRYYILTTHHQHEPTKEILEEVEEVKRLLGCQLIVNGVIPTIKYYLRLLVNPGAVIKEYTTVLEKDSTVGFEHRDVWNKLATGEISLK